MSTFEKRHLDALGRNRERLSDGVPEREEIRQLLLELDDEIPPSPFPSTRVLGLDLYRHWSAEHRTALWFPNPHNNYRVNEIYLRYGKSEAEIRSFRDAIPPVLDEPPDLGGFPAHIHLAIGLCANGFFYHLVIGPKSLSNKTLIPPMVSRYSDWCFGQHNRLVETTLSLEKPASPDKSRLFENASHFGP